MMAGITSTPLLPLACVTSPSCIHGMSFQALAFHGVAESAPFWACADIASAEDCCAKCVATSGCKFFT
jgi:hypothetical protein